VLTLEVNSAEWGGADASPGDHVCETASGTGKCTLRAAIEESNALGAQPGEVAITVDSSIGIGTKMSGGTLTNMITSQITNGISSGGAYFNVTSPVTIDLGHRLQVDGSGNSGGYATAFYLNGPDIQVLNADNVMSSGTSFVVGPQANRVTINGDTTGEYGQITAPNTTPRRFIVFREGASNVTVTNYQVSFRYGDATWGGIFIFDSFSPYTAMTNIVVDRVKVAYPSGAGPRLTNFWYLTPSGADALGWAGSSGALNTVKGLTFTNMQVQNLPEQYGFQFGEAGDTNGNDSAAISDLVIENNVFLNNQGYRSGSDLGYAFITLPYVNNLTGTNSISNNVFTRASSGQYYAIIYYGNGGSATNSTTASGLTIANNYFNGYTGGATIRNERAGLVTVTGNTFGPATGSQAATPVATPGVAEEYADAASVMYNTYHSPTGSTNQAIRTWAPSAPASVLAGPVPSGAVVMDDPREGAVPTCPATVPVIKITDPSTPATQPPGEPVTLQAYWTGSKTAEVYLGEVEGVTGASATVVLQLPVGAMPLPDGGTATVVNATSGVASGYIRLQTHVEGLAQLESSQYSRLVAVSGTCRPVVTINQADDMTDPTYGRDLHFTLSSSVPLDPSTVTADDIDFHVTPVAETVDPDRINPRVVSVEPVPGGDDMEFDVILRVDDSAQVSVSLAAQMVATTAGLTNQNPAASTDDSVTFLNPLRVNPSSFTLVTGEATGKSFTISVAPPAPVPQADVMFTALVDQPQTTPMVSLSTTGPVLQAGQQATPPVGVTAASGDVAANTRAAITMTAESSDTNYDGLVVPTVTAYLFSTDPTITIQKRAYTDVGDPSSPAQIEATGTLAPSGTRLMDRQAVCFVYTVSNVSRDDWATSLADIEVTDSDTRLGLNGLIGTVGSLGAGQSVKLSWCTSLQPGDTTVGN